MSSSAFGQSNGSGVGSGFSINLPGVSDATSNLGGLVSSGSGVADDLSSQVLDGSAFGEIGSDVAAASSSMQDGLSNGLNQTLGLLGTLNTNVQASASGYDQLDSAIADGFGGIGSGDSLAPAASACPPSVASPTGEVANATVGFGPGAVSVGFAEDPQNVSVTLEGLAGDMEGASVYAGPGGVPPTGAFVTAQGSVGPARLSATVGTSGASATASVPMTLNPGVSLQERGTAAVNENGCPSYSDTTNLGAGNLTGAGVGGGVTITVSRQTLDAVGQGYDAAASEGDISPVIAPY